MSARTRSQSPRAPKSSTTRQRSKSPSSARSDSKGDYFFVGLVSSFPDITPDSTESITQLHQPSTKGTLTPTPNDTPSQPDDPPTPNANTDDNHTDNTEQPPLPPCKIFSNLSPGPPRRLSLSSSASSDLASQVLIFRYRNKIHAIDHRCPHMSHPLSHGSLHDIEDFGVVLSAGITCAKHGWDFDLFTGEGDRGSYRLGLWDVQVRLGNGRESEKGRENDEDGIRDGDVDGVDAGREEVWVRRRGRRERVG